MAGSDHDHQRRQLAASHDGVHQRKPASIAQEHVDAAAEEPEKTAGHPGSARHARGRVQQEPDADGGGAGTHRPGY